jgi:hypothetical protein
MGMGLRTPETTPSQQVMGAELLPTYQSSQRHHFASRVESCALAQPTHCQYVSKLAIVSSLGTFVATLSRFALALMMQLSPIQELLQAEIHRQTLSLL